MVTCRSRSDDEYLPDVFPYAALDLTPSLASRFLSYKPQWDQVFQFNSNLFSLEFFNYECEWGSWDRCNEEDWDWDEVGGWLQAPPGKFHKERTDANCLVVSSRGVYWTARPKHGVGCLESEMITWEELERVARGEVPFPPCLVTSEEEE